MSSRRSTGPGGQGAGLSSGAIVSAALALMDEDGVDAFTMRKLAARLGVRSGALYWHFSNKDALCRAVVDAVGAQLKVPRSSRGTPRERLALHFTTLREHWRHHPSALALGRRYPPAAAGAFAAEGIRLVRQLGFPEPVAAEQYRLLTWLVLGFVYVEQGVAESVHHRAVDPGGRTYAVTLSREAPQPDFLVNTDEVFERTLRLVFDGLDVARESAE